MSNEPNNSVIERLVVVETEMRLHAAECVSYRLETRDQLKSLVRNVDLLVSQSNKAEGRAEVNKLLFGNIPNTFWAAAIAGLAALGSSLVTIVVLWLRHGMS